jgi:hypothetical protein
VVVLNSAQPYGVAEVADATHVRVWGVIAAARTQRQQRSRDAALDAILSELRASDHGDGAEDAAFETSMQVTA